MISRSGTEFRPEPITTRKCNQSCYLRTTNRPPIMSQIKSESQINRAGIITVSNCNCKLIICKCMVGIDVILIHVIN